MGEGGHSRPSGRGLCLPEDFLGYDFVLRFPSLVGVQGAEVTMSSPSPARGVEGAYAALAVCSGIGRALASGARRAIPCGTLRGGWYARETDDGVMYGRGNSEKRPQEIIHEKTREQGPPAQPTVHPKK